MAPKRPSKEIRDENIFDFKAFTLKFEGLPDADKVATKSPLGNWSTLCHMPKPEHCKVTAKCIASFGTADRKGYTVLKDTGCLIPHYTYAGYSGSGKTDPAYKLFFERFYGFNPVDLVRKPAAELLYTDWPCGLNISHLCHRRACCRPDHLALESAWRNAKRNYCGLLGYCDCSIGTGGKVNALQPECVRRYSTSPALAKKETPSIDVLRGLHQKQLGPDSNICQTMEEVDEILLKTNFKINVAEYSYVDYIARDQKAAKRAARFTKAGLRVVEEVALDESDVEPVPDDEDAEI